MRIKLLTIGSEKEPWLVEFISKYTKKINPLCPFEFIRLKPKGLDRARSSEKKEKESEQLLAKIDSRDQVILFDERGKKFDSMNFSKKLVENLESGKNVVFVIGGAFGASEGLKNRANAIWQLSDLTFSHQIAQTVAMEQIYRGLSIWKGLPYHNE